MLGWEPKFKSMRMGTHLMEISTCGVHMVKGFKPDGGICSILRFYYSAKERIHQKLVSNVLKL